MEGRFEFEGAEVRALLDEANAADENVMTEAQRLVASGVDLHGDPAEDVEVDHPGTGAPPGLWLMNDRGVYLRSNAESGGGDSIAHARGYRADVQVGDETVCEFIDGAQLAPVRPGDTLVVALSEDRMRLSLVREA